MLAAPSANLSEFKDALKKEFDVDVSVSTISRLFEEKAIVKKMVTLCICIGVNQGPVGEGSEST